MKRKEPLRLIPLEDLKKVLAEIVDPVVPQSKAAMRRQKKVERKPAKREDAPRLHRRLGAPHKKHCVLRRPGYRCGAMVCVCSPLQDMRKRMHAKFGIDPQMELHVTDFWADVNLLLVSRYVPTRVKIAGGVMKIISKLPSLQIIGVSMEH